MKQELKYSLISNSLSGMFRFRENLLNKFIEQSQQVHLISPYDDKSRNTTDRPLEIHDWYASRTGKNIISEVRSIFNLIFLLKKIKPNLVISYTIKPNSYAPLVCKVLGIPIICVVTGLGYAYSNKGFAAFMGRQLLRLGLRLSSHVLTLNAHDRMRLCQQNPKLESKIDILPGEGIDTSYYHSQTPIQNNTISFAFIGRLLKDKGVYEFIEAARALRERHGEVNFIIMGPHDTDNPATIDFADIERAENDGVIIYKPATEDVRPMIEQSTCIVLPSYHEGMPRILLEAASMERPMVATNIPGCSDIVIDQETGLLCEPKNTESLINAMERFIILSHEEKIHMGKRARQHVIDHFSDEIVIKKYEEIIDKVMREHKA